MPRKAEDKCATCGGSDEKPDWIDCDVCKRWFHQECEFIKLPAGIELSWMCFECRKSKAPETSQQAVMLNELQRLKEKEIEFDRLMNELKAGKSDKSIQEDKTESKRSGRHRKQRSFDEESDIELEGGKESGSAFNRPKFLRNLRRGLKFETEITSPVKDRLPAKSELWNAPEKPVKRKSRKYDSTDSEDDSDGGISDRRTRPSGHRRKAESEDTDNDINRVLCQLTKMMLKQNLEPLPDFSGEVDKWPVFYAQYKNTKDQLTNSENVQRLRTSVKGDAFKLVKAKLAFSRDPDDIINTLKTAYGSVDGTTRNIISRLRSLPVPDESSAASIRSFKAEIEEAYAMLVSLGAKKYLKSPTIVDDIIARLPVGMKRNWGSYAKNELRLRPGDAELEDLVNWIDEYSEWTLWDTKETTRKKEKSQKSNESRGRVNVHSEAVNNSGSCRECNEVGHYLVKCPKFAKMSVDERWESAKRKSLCFTCLNKRHKSECQRRRRCGVDGCERFHHPLLHNGPLNEKPVNQEKQEEKENPKNPPKDPQKKENFNGTLNANEKRTSVIFRIMPVKLTANGKTRIINAFFDEGSSQSLLLQNVAKEIGILGVKEPLSLSWTDDSVKVEQDSEIVSFEVAGVQERSLKFWMRDVRTVSQLSLPFPQLSVQKFQQEFDHLKGITIPQPLNETPCLLIGLKHSKLGLPFEKREGRWEDPIATHTRLGWVIHGCQAGTQSKENFVCVMDTVNRDQDLNMIVRNFFSLESFGVRASSNHRESLELTRSRKIFDDTLKKTENGYEIGLLWRSDDIILPDNREMAVKRFLSFEKQMERDPEFGKLCREKFNKSLEKGYLRKLSHEESKQRSARTWYLPIFAVKNPNKPGSVRLVYDAAAEFCGVSLNGNLLKGLDMSTSLVGILWTARERDILLVTDINDMFNRISMKIEDQDSQRIVWRDEMKQELETYVVTVVTFGPTSSPSSAQEVKDRNADKFKDKYPRAVLCIKKRHYVDDAIDSFNSVEEAVKTAREVTMIHKQAGFELKDWISNSNEVMMQLNGHDSKPGEMSLELDSGAIKILGMYWDPIEDIFTFSLNFARVDPQIVSLERVPTKREILRMLASVFDPHGMLSPILVESKILLQDVWRHGIDWDQQLPENLFEKWCRCVNEIKGAEVVKVPRCYSVDAEAAAVIQLHTFSDASENAFAAVSYLRFIFDDGRVEVAFVASKSKVAPLKHLSIPRLELQGAVMATRLAATIVQEHSLNIAEKFFWTDSQTVLSWITSDHRRYKPFVANRVSEILDHSTMIEWNWIAGKLNVADDGTKHKANYDMTMNGRWFSGPEFLRLKEDEWEVQQNPKTEIKDDDELRAVNVHREAEKLYDCIDASRFSKWSRLVRAVAYVLRFINNCRSEQKQRSSLTPDEIKKAELMLLKKVQFDSYRGELISLERDNKVEKASKIWTLTPTLAEDGLIRLRGRIDAAPFVTEEFKRPVILDRRHALTLLIVKAYHDRFHHGNSETVVAELRQRFWINEIRVVVKQVANNCQMCKNRRSQPVVPEMCPLPEARLMSFEKPFTYVGLDYLGPIMVTVGRRHEKRWVALYTCLVIRAVHLEVVSSLDTSSCIMATRNFMLRRGPPKAIYCDNGTSMHGAESELRRSIEQLDQQRLQNDAQLLLPGETRTEWRFIPPLSPHMGGAWERLVKSVKSVLYCCLRDRAPKEEVLRSFLMEAEYTVNSRPLTYQSIETDTQEPLTPNRILQLGGQIVYSPGVFDTKEFARKPWRFSQQLADEFWKRWVKEYLPVLTKRTKWFQEQPDLQVGDVVVIVDEGAPRNLWSKGIVQQIVPSKDGKIRSVIVKTAKSSYQRPVAKLARLDVRSDSN